MKYRILTVLALVAVALALTFAISIPAAAPAAAAPHVAAPAALALTATPSPEPHPEIHEAINSLRHAREHLQHAAHDFGGHREEAIRAIDAAIHQLEVCLDYDK
jgi:hypothetical protein